MQDLTKFDAIASKLSAFLVPLRGITVRDKTELAAAKGAMTTIKSLQKDVENERVALVRPYNETVNAINARAKEVTHPLNLAEAEVKNAVATYVRYENERIAKARRIAEETAALEARRLHEDHERMLKAKAEEDAKVRAATKAANAFGVDEDKEAIEAAAEKRRRQYAEQEAKHGAHEAARRERLAQEQKALERERPKATSTVWRFEIVERLEVPMDYWSVDEVKLGQAVRGGAREIPGVRIYSEQVVVAGR